MDRVRPTRADPLDAAVAAGVTALVLADAVLGPARPTVPDHLLLAASALALAARSRAPRTVLLVSLGCGLAYTLRVEPGPVATVPVLIAVYTVVAAGHRVLGAAVTVPLMVFAVVDNLTAAPPAAPPAQALQEAILPVGWFVAVVVLGEVTRHRRAYLDQAERRAAEALRTREEVARRRASEERLRIARELHDSLTHQISVIKVQAEVAVHLARKRGEDVPEALLAVQQAGREATEELRATLDVLRDTDEDTRGRGVDRLPDLVRSASATRVAATVTIRGDERALPADIDAAVFRIVQESLTNVGRHADTDSASVTLRYDGDVLTVRVDDDGAAVPGTDPVPGTGLLGMRERVTALGGRLRAGPRAHGGFTVEASLPLPGGHR